eukprot:2570024-Amphidinium_carterae.2
MSNSSKGKPSLVRSRESAPSCSMAILYTTTAPQLGEVQMEKNDEADRHTTLSNGIHTPCTAALSTSKWSAPEDAENHIHDVLLSP